MIALSIPAHLPTYHVRSYISFESGKLAWLSINSNSNKISMKTFGPKYLFLTRFSWPMITVQDSKWALAPKWSLGSEMIPDQKWSPDCLRNDPQWNSGMVEFSPVPFFFSFSFFCFTGVFYLPSFLLSLSIFLPSFRLSLWSLFFFLPFFL